MATKLFAGVGLAILLALAASSSEALEWTGSAECEAEAFDWYGTNEARRIEDT